MTKGEFYEIVAQIDIDAAEFAKDKGEYKGILENAYALGAYILLKKLCKEYYFPPLSLVTAGRGQNKRDMKKITKERLAELLKAEHKLGLLEAYGVDNWDGYGEAINNVYNPEGMSCQEFDNMTDDELTKEFKDID